MQHTKHAIERHNGPVGWIVLITLLWILISGLMNDHTPDYEADRVEQSQ